MKRSAPPSASRPARQRRSCRARGQSCVSRWRTLKENGCHDGSARRPEVRALAQGRGARLQRAAGDTARQDVAAHPECTGQQAGHCAPSLDGVGGGCCRVTGARHRHRSLVNESVVAIRTLHSCGASVCRTGDRLARQSGVAGRGNAILLAHRDVPHDVPGGCQSRREHRAVGAAGARLAHHRAADARFARGQGSAHARAARRSGARVDADLAPQSGAERSRPRSHHPRYEPNQRVAQVALGDSRRARTGAHSRSALMLSGLSLLLAVTTVVQATPTTPTPPPARAPRAHRRPPVAAQVTVAPFAEAQASIEAAAAALQMAQPDFAALSAQAPTFALVAPQLQAATAELAAAPMALVGPSMALTIAPSIMWGTDDDDEELEPAFPQQSQTDVADSVYR